MRMRVFIIAILASLSLVSCTAEIGNPIAASYEVKSLESDDSSNGNRSSGTTVSGASTCA